MLYRKMESWKEGKGKMGRESEMEKGWEKVKREMKSMIRTDGKFEREGERENQNECIPLYTEGPGNCLV